MLFEDFLLSPRSFLFVAGPCALETREQMETFIKNSPCKGVRAGIYKMRTHANSFQGLGATGIEIIKEIKKEKDFSFITEVTDPRQIDGLMPICDAFMVGCRNMYNYELLKELNKTERPVILKRAFSATVVEWLSAAEYMPDLGTEKIILCERGIRTFENVTRNTLDINSVIYLKQNHSFKVLIDPSHASGHSRMIEPLCHVAVSCGADGVLVESHPHPEKALSDKEQAISVEDLERIYTQLKKVCGLYERQLI